MLGAYVAVYVFGLMGVAGHWLTRWAQERTQSNFKEYLMEEKGRTMASIFSNLASSTTICLALVDGMTSQQIFMTVAGAYMAGYTLDSTLNKDAKPSLPKQEKVDETKNIDDLLSDDSKL